MVVCFALLLWRVSSYGKGSAGAAASNAAKKAGRATKAAAADPQVTRNPPPPYVTARLTLQGVTRPFGLLHMRLDGDEPGLCVGVPSLPVCRSSQA